MHAQMYAFRQSLHFLHEVLVPMFVKRTVVLPLGILFQILLGLVLFLIWSIPLCSINILLYKSINKHNNILK